MKNTKLKKYNLNVKAIQFIPETIDIVLEILKTNGYEYTCSINDTIIDFSLNYIHNRIIMYQWLVVIDTTIFSMNTLEFNALRTHNKSKTVSEFINSSPGVSKPSCGTCSNKAKKVCNSCINYDTYEPIWKEIK